MVENRHRVQVNIKSNIFRAVPEVVANDKVIFEIEVWDGATRFPLLETYSYMLTSLKLGGQSVIREGTLSGDLIVFELGTSEMTVPGKVEGTVQIYDENNDRISSAKFDYVVKRDPSLQGSLPADNTSLIIANESLLTESVQKSDAAIADSSTALTKATAAETTANDVRSEFDLVVAEAGSSNPEVVQARDTFVNLNERLKHTDAQLADVVKFPTEIYTPLKSVEETKQTFNATTLKTAITAGTVNAVYWGDSITEYSDAINPNDIYPMYFHQELRKSFPGVTFNYYNRAIRATNVYDANNSAYVPAENSLRPWTVGNTKVWREVVRDLQPDVLFLAFGMNATTISATITNLEGVLAYIATWTKVPTVVMITTPSPSKDFYTQSSIDTRIQCSRIHAYEGLINNFYVMDIGKKYRSLVDGVDENALYSRGVTLSDFVNENPTYISINGTVVRFTGAKRYLTSNDKFYNFYLECDVDFETAGLFRVEFRNDRNVIHVGKDRFTLYTKEGGTTLFTKPYTTNVGYNKVKIEVKENMFYITINGTTWEYNKMVYGTLENSLYLTAADSNAVTINNLNISKYEYPTHKPLVEDMDVLWGAYDGTTNLKIPYGGNGANHPSSIGNLMIYYDAIHPFIKAVKEQL